MARKSKSNPGMVSTSSDPMIMSAILVIVAITGAIVVLASQKYMLVKQIEIESSLDSPVVISEVESAN